MLEHSRCDLDLIETLRIDRACAESMRVHHSIGRWTLLVTALAPTSSPSGPVRRLRPLPALHTIVVFGQSLREEFQLITEPCRSARINNYEEAIRFCLSKRDLEVQYE